MTKFLALGLVVGALSAGATTASAAPCTCVVKWTRYYAHHTGARVALGHDLRNRGVKTPDRTGVRRELLRAWRARFTGPCLQNAKVCRAVIACLAAAGSTMGGALVAGTPFRIAFFEGEINCAAAAGAVLLSP